MGMMAARLQVLPPLRAACAPRSMAHALIVEDDAEAALLLATQVASRGFSVACAGTLLDARRQLSLQPVDLLLLDLQLPDGNGLALLEDKDLLGSPEVVLMTGQPPLASSLRAGRHGGLDCLAKPFSLAQLQESLTRHRPSHRLGLLVGRSQAMQTVYRQMRRVAPTHFTVFLTGESGTGKELAARTLHDLSRRRARPFVAVNCGALSPHLVESEMFGHERGSFTGAERQHAGFFEQARGGTLFLDEITEMPLPLQVKLLRVLESGSFMRVGATCAQSADVRVVAASNRDPAQAVAQGQLREDLFWRLHVFPLAMPPLSARHEDIPLLAAHLLAEIGQAEGEARQLDEAGLAALSRREWPGNVRELRNVLKRAWVLGDGPALDPGLLGEPAPPARGPAPARQDGTYLRLPLGISLAEAERQLIEATLVHHGHHREQAAATLGVSLKTLYNRLREYGMPAAGLPVAPTRRPLMPSGTSTPTTPAATDRQPGARA